MYVPAITYPFYGVQLCQQPLKVLHDNIN